MRILMLGNSYTSSNDLPGLLAEKLDAEVTAHTRGGARLAEQLNPKTKLGARTLEALARRDLDYVVLQEMSNGPISSREKFLKTVSELCQLIREHGAEPVLYATWAYEEGGAAMKRFTERTGMSYEKMYQGMHDGYRKAAEQNHALMADVGSRFHERADAEILFAADGSHPSLRGSQIASDVIAEVIVNNERR